ncbi:10823_t:CDS:1 [Paraglomus brasilianum]|uniref:10823_t:CDS:1 n=1 Tax=Paraglomus brasilianum TaxID=144538 RepID=A0A9N9CW38_9GLOM|nr:10823_t:CDS:1 [Paraglomus brasilianum]
MNHQTIIFHSDLSGRSISSLLSGIVPPPNITLSMEELINCSKVPRSVQRGHTDIARPPNRFMIYRRDFLARKRRGIDGAFNMARLSVEAAAQWKREPPEVIRFFTQISDVVRELHHKTHPYYKYSPRKGPKQVGINNRMPRRRRYKPKIKKEECVFQTAQKSDCVDEQEGVDNSSSSNDEFFDCIEEFSDCGF